MINVSIDIPKLSHCLEKHKKEIRENLEELQENPKEKKFNQNIWKNLKHLLMSMCKEKCAYCEEWKEKGELQIEHYRPKGLVKENKNHDGYWWLAYEPSNLLLACGPCNRNKGSHFPLEKGEVHRVFDINGTLSEESPLIINPSKEDPQDHIKYNFEDLCEMEGITAKGKKTISCLRLNRHHLLEKRRGKLRLIRIAEAINKDDIKRMIHKELLSSKGMEGMIFQYFKNSREYSNEG